MLSILLAVIFGLGVGYFATENTTPVALRFGDFVIENVPLYLVAVGSILAGLVIAWIFYLTRQVAGSMTMAGKARDTSTIERNMADLNYRVRELEAGYAKPRLEPRLDHPSDSRLAS